MAATAWSPIRPEHPTPATNRRSGPRIRGGQHGYGTQGEDGSVSISPSCAISRLISISPIMANAEVAGVAKQIIAQYYAKPAAYSYFVGCSTGGREGMILSQRYPTVFNGIVSGDPAMRTGLSNLAIGKWIPVAYNQAAPKDASGKPQIDKLLTEARSQALHGLR